MATGETLQLWRFIRERKVLSRYCGPSIQERTGVKGDQALRFTRRSECDMQGVESSKQYGFCRKQYALRKTVDRWSEVYSPERAGIRISEQGVTNSCGLRGADNPLAPPSNCRNDLGKSEFRNHEVRAVTKNLARTSLSRSGT